MKLSVHQVVWLTMALLLLRMRPTIASSRQKQTLPGQEQCAEFFFYDHGTEHCEHCRDLCDGATVKGTMTACWTRCQSYALVLWPPHPTPTRAAATAKPGAGGNDSGSSDNHQLTLKIAIPLLSVALIVGTAVGLAFMRFRSNALKNRRKRPPPDQTVSTAVYQTATVEIPDDSGENDAVDGSMVMGSAGATCGTEASSSTAGIQEETEMHHSNEGSQADGRERIVAQATSSHLNNIPQEPRSPVPVSPEGQDAPYAMALLHSSVRASTYTFPTSACSQLPPSASVYEPELDLDSTELKSLLPTMSEDSILAASGES